MSDRLSALDFTKVVGLICLFIIHSTLLNSDFPELRAILFGFVDASFMFMAGYLYKRSVAKPNYTLNHFWQGKLRTLIFPTILIIILLYLISGVPLSLDFAKSVAVYSLGLRFFMPPLIYGLDFWFISVLITYFVIFSLLGNKRVIPVIVTFAIVLVGFFYMINTPQDNFLLLPAFFLYIIAFITGYSWTMKFNDHRVLLIIPVILPFIFNVTAINLNLWGSVFMLTEQLKLLVIGIGLTLLCLYIFSYLKKPILVKAVAYVGTYSLAVYLLEPLISWVSLWIIFPLQFGSLDVYTLSAMDSAKRLPLSIVLGFVLCPLIIKLIDKLYNRCGLILNFLKNNFNLLKLRFTKAY
jgi:hypothetical protein